MKQKILFHQRMIPHYQYPLCLELIKKNKNMIFVYGNSNKGESLINANINRSRNFIYMKNYYPWKTNSTFYTPLFNIIRQLKPKIIISQGNVGNLSLLLLLLLRVFYNYKLILWSHGWDRRNNLDPERSLIDKYRLVLQNAADALILYSESAKHELSKYLNINKIFVAPNTLDTDRLSIIRQGLEKKDRDTLKYEIGLNKKYYIVYSARLEKNKNPLKLIKMYEIIKKVNDNIGLNIIGDGPLLHEIKETILRKELRDVNFMGAIYDYETTGKIIYCSDLMIIPQSAGLSIIHSFCFACPVVILDDKQNMPEIDYVIDNETGMLLYGHKDDEVISRINHYLKNVTLQKEMRQNCVNKVNKDASMNNYLEKFLESINYTMDLH